jgi:hypothetical protein
MIQKYLVVHYVIVMLMTMIFLSYCKRLYKNNVACESKCQGCPNPIKLDKTRSIVTILITSLRDVYANL